MLETVLKLYVMAMAGDVRSPICHLFGPPGCGKSSVVEQAAEMLGVNLHTVNVSRISPLELEGVQMPDKEHSSLNLLLSTTWSKLKDGDIVLWDEFLRGFPEVYNGLLDIMTSRNVAGFQLPKVFFIAASNSTVAYDKALEDRLLHIPAPDPRKDKGEDQRIRTIITEKLGLMPTMINSYEMRDLVSHEIHPTYELLDALKNKNPVGTASVKGSSVRNLIGQAKLRHIESSWLRSLLTANNNAAMASSKPQYVLLYEGKNAPTGYKELAEKLLRSTKLTPQQRTTISLNLQLIGMEEARKETETVHEFDDIFLA